MQNNFELVKDRLPIKTLAEYYNSTVRSDKYIKPCPACSHKDCCSYDKVKNLWHCKSCDEGGSVIDMIMAVDNCTDAEALRRGAEIAGVELKESQTSERKQKQETEKARMYRLTAAFYEKAMAKPGCKGKEWFCGTRGHKEAVLKKMRVGWAPKKGGLIPYLTDHGFTETDILKFGLASNTRQGKPVNIYEWYRGVAVFPVIDLDGRVISFTAKDPEKKKMASFMKGATGKPWFINYPELGRRHNELFVVEGENDVASLMDAGFPNVIGTAGSPSDDQIRLIRNFCSGVTLFLWFDKDIRDPRKNSGGHSYTRKLYKALKDDNIDIKIIVHPGATKDADDYIREGYKA